MRIFVLVQNCFFSSVFSIVVGLEEEEDDDTDTGHMVTLVCEVVDVE
jgi:hypothetical protein